MNFLLSISGRALLEWYSCPPRFVVLIPFFVCFSYSASLQKLWWYVLWQMYQRKNCPHSWWECSTSSSLRPMHGMHSWQALLLKCFLFTTIIERKVLSLSHYNYLQHSCLVVMPTQLFPSFLSFFAGRSYSKADKYEGNNWKSSRIPQSWGSCKKT